MNPTAHYTGGWVVPRAHPDGYGEKKISHLHLELEPRPVHPVAICHIFYVFMAFLILKCKDIKKVFCVQILEHITVDVHFL